MFRVRALGIALLLALGVTAYAAATPAGPSNRTRGGASRSGTIATRPIPPGTPQADAPSSKAM